MDVMGKVSFAVEAVGPDGVRIDLDVVVRSCDEAIARRPGDGSIPRVTIGADALREIASFARSVADIANPSLAPVVSGPGAADTWGEVIYPFHGHPLNSTAFTWRRDDPPRGARCLVTFRDVRPSRVVIARCLDTTEGSGWFSAFGRIDRVVAWMLVPEAATDEGPPIVDVGDSPGA